METNDDLKGTCEMDPGTSKDNLDCYVEAGNNTDLKTKRDGSETMEEDEFFDAKVSQNLNLANNKNGNKNLHASNSKQHHLSGNSDTKNLDSTNLEKGEKQGDNMFKNKNDLTQFIVMQLELIGHQQLQIQQKDKKIISLKTEKEQLEAKLSRMERRISIQKRHSLELTAGHDDNMTLTRSKVNSPSIKSPLVGAFAQKKVASIETSVDKANMAPITITSCNDKGFSFENFLRTNVTYSDPPFKKRLCKKIVQNIETDNIEKKVPVPPWRILGKCNNEIQGIEENLEDISDAAYERRHSKPELEEKRRKRWDLQQARQQRQHEQLVQRYNEREQKSKLQNNGMGDVHAKLKHNTIEHLARDSNHLHAVDVTEIVPVCAFGYPLPALAPRELDIPWFSIAKREVQLRTAKQKQVTKAKKKVKSSIISQRRRKPKF